MNSNKILVIIEEWVKNSCASDPSGHDWYHIERVRNLSLAINKNEQRDTFIILMIATLHDLFDHKFYIEWNGGK